MPRRAGVFTRELAERTPKGPTPGRTWLFVGYDQLNDGMGLLAERAPESLGIIVVENPAKAARRPYHKQKLALVVANLRHFALEQAARGVAVRHVVADEGGYAGALERAARELGPIVVYEPAERELRLELAPLIGREVVQRPHPGWLTTETQFGRAARSGPPYRMDAFYRVVRRDLDVLMTGGQPVGGKFSFDADNRKRWNGTPAAPDPPRYQPDAVTLEVVELIETRYAKHPGRVDASALPATRADAERAWAWALEACLPHFGPFEDAMSTRSSSLFHTRISALLNLHRLLPARVLHDALAAELPLASQEGFVRQILGWREFVRHVHRETAGFTRPLLQSGAAAALADAAAAPSFLGASRPLPPAYWGKTYGPRTTRSGLNCLDRVIDDVWEEAYSHHITRLMVLGNIATLLDVSPRELTDWFWVAYSDAYDWVVEPNVLAMATYGTGDLMTTKPYVAGAAYVDRMSDYCAQCAFDPAKNCPLTPMYWAFLERHRESLAGNRRIALPLASARKRSDARRARDAAVFEAVSQRLSAGETLDPETLP